MLPSGPVPCPEKLLGSRLGASMVSFNVVSLFIRVPIKGTMDLLGHHFKDDLGLFAIS
jgi:hypothetical protein